MNFKPSRRPPCAHCKKAPAARPRGLCCRCFKDMAIRLRYGRTVRGKAVADTDFDTMAEVEAVVAAGMLALPDWWAADAEKMRQFDAAGFRMTKSLGDDAPGADGEPPERPGGRPRGVPPGPGVAPRRKGCRGGTAGRHDCDD